MALEYRCDLWFIAIFRLAVIMLYSYSFHISHHLLGISLKYLTNWNLVIQLLYFLFGFFKLFLPLPTAPPLQRASSSSPSARSSSSSSSLASLPPPIPPPSARQSKLWTYFGASIVFPTCFFVFSTFWVLYFIDRELIFPKRLDEIVPGWINHTMHTAIMPFLLLDRFLVKFQYPRFKRGVKVGLAFASIYLFSLVLFYLSYGSWVYPILNSLEWPGRILFMFFCFFLFIPSYFIGHLFNITFWGKYSIGSPNRRERRRIRKARARSE